MSHITRGRRDEDDFDFDDDRSISPAGIHDDSSYDGLYSNMNNEENPKIYKIRRKKDGKFSGGGFSPSWRKNGGKFWQLIHLKQHLLHIKEYLQKRGHKAYDRDCEVVEYELVEKRRIPVEEFIKTIKRKS